MFLLIIFLLCMLCALGAGILASYSDFKGLTIDNIYSVIVIGSFSVCYLVLWLFGRPDVFSPILSHLLSALLVFIVTVGMFAAGVMGAADSKLGTAYALWVGVKGLVPFLFYMALAGGALAFIALALRKWTPVKAPPEGSWIACVQAGESKVPYGIAIFVGAFSSFVYMGYFNIEVFRSFILK